MLSERFGRTLTILPVLESNLLSELRSSSIGIASHDAGGAHILEAFIRSNKLVPERLYISGPAEKIFSATPTTDRSLEIDSPKVLLATTGWQSNFEKINIKAALEQNVRTIVFLDHWTNFKERMEYSTKQLLVSEFVTFDEAAKELASECFLDAIIYCFPNYYLIEQSTKIKTLRFALDSLDIDYLYIGEPINNQGYSEKDAFSNFLKKMSYQETDSLRLALRPHPSQSLESYFEILAEFSTFSVHVTQETTLAEDLARSKAVVGCQSMAIKLAHMSQIPVYCAVPKPFTSKLPASLFESWK